MSWGSQNEFLIFPIIELIDKEIKRLMLQGELSISNLERYSSLQNPNIVFSQVTNQTNIQVRQALSLLESNDYKLSLKKDEEGKLQNVEIRYTDDIRALIELVRQSGKLSLVRVNLLSKEEMKDEVSNPFGMMKIDFFEYVRNKYLWERYNEIYTDDSQPQEKRDKAKQRMDELHARNGELRNKYGVKEENDLSYEELKGLVPNIMCMDEYDFIEYCRNMRWWFATDSQEEKDEAHQRNVELRQKYNIAEEDAAMFKLEDVKDDLPNPLGMHTEDFKTYVENREKIEEAVEITDEIQALMEINQKLLQEYYIEDTYTLDELKQYLVSESEDNEVLLLQIEISLSYNKEGKLENVESKTVVGNF